MSAFLITMIVLLGIEGATKLALWGQPREPIGPLTALVIAAIDGALVWWAFNLLMAIK